MLRLRLDGLIHADPRTPPSERERSVDQDDGCAIEQSERDAVRRRTVSCTCCDSQVGRKLPEPGVKLAVETAEGCFAAFRPSADGVQLEKDILDDLGESVRREPWRWKCMMSHLGKLTHALEIDARAQGVSLVILNAVRWGERVRNPRQVVFTLVDCENGSAILRDLVCSAEEDHAHSGGA